MHEAKVMEILKGGIGIPDIFHKAAILNPNNTKETLLIIALELLGPSLEDLIKIYPKMLKGEVFGRVVVNPNK